MLQKDLFLPHESTLLSHIVPGIPTNVLQKLILLYGRTYIIYSEITRATFVGFAAQWRYVYKH